MADKTSMLPAERLASEATSLPAFPINLLDVRRNVETIMNEFRRHGFFEEYTVHDFSHCLEMIKLLDWVIPDETRKIMSGADWLMIVLACYFHDMGLIVTRDEFDARATTAFERFCTEHLFGGPTGADYKAKIDSLPSDQRERFLYQEFVRANHSTRIKAWIEGRPLTKLGSTAAAFNEIQGILAKLPTAFRRDLGMVCESHNLDDIQVIKKYRLSQPYGNSDDETANLQYAAILLRTVDLLQITQHRAPAALYRLINPTDPISQREWAKQNAVTRVRPKIGVDKDGNPDPAAPTTTVEVFAELINEDGFFGLTSYLAYARNQIKQSSEAAEKSRKLTIRPYIFPWRDIDDSRVEAHGFLRETFEFELDQAKILDLLTGHTLYNDSNVVLRVASELHRRSQTSSFHREQG
jgi:molecular chaperone HtpG